MAKGSVLSQPNGMELIPSELFLIRDGPLFLGGREGIGVLGWCAGALKFCRWASFTTF